MKAVSDNTAAMATTIKLARCSSNRPMRSRDADEYVGCSGFCGSCAGAGSSTETVSDAIPGDSEFLIESGALVEGSGVVIEGDEGSKGSGFVRAGDESLKASGFVVDGDEWSEDSGFIIVGAELSKDSSSVLTAGTAGAN